MEFFASSFSMVLLVGLFHAHFPKKVRAQFLAPLLNPNSLSLVPSYGPETFSRPPLDPRQLQSSPLFLLGPTGFFSPPFSAYLPLTLSSLDILSFLWCPRPYLLQPLASPLLMAILGLQALHPIRPSFVHSLAILMKSSIGFFPMLLLLALICL